MNPLFKDKKVLFSILGLLLILLIGTISYVSWRYYPILTSPFNEKANPLKVNVSFTEKTATKLIDSKGGEIALEGSVLSFPKDSVLDSEKIILKQIKSIQGMGEGATFVTGVEATPDGNSLLSPAELKIPVTNTSRLIGFAYEGEGDNFHLYPVKIQDNQVVFRVTHFSGYGIINVGDGSYTPPTPETIEAKAQQLIAKIILEGQNETGDLSENQINRIYNLMNVWWKTDIKLNLEKSVNNGDLVIPAFEKYNVWLAGIQLLGIDQRFAKEQEYAMKTAAKATKNAYESASKKCSEQKDPTQIAKMTKLAKFAMKWGLNHKEGLNVDDLLEKTKNCAVFELRMNYTTSFPKFGISMNASGSVSIIMDNAYNLVGNGIIKQNSLDPEDDFSCSYASGGMPSFPVKVASTKLDVSGGPKSSIILEFSDVDNTLVCKSTLPGVDFTSTSGSDDWLTDYFIIHYDEDYQDPGLFSISDWQTVNKDGVYLKKSVNRDKFINNGHPELNYTLHENTTYELIHKPKG